MSESINNKIKDCFDQVYKNGDKIVLVKDEKGNPKETFGHEFLKNMDSAYLSDKLKYKKWCIEASEQDKEDINKFKSFAFINSEEFKKWPDEKKALAFQSYGAKYSGIKKEDSKEDLITLDDCKTFIKANPNWPHWPPYLKAMSSYLIPVAKLEKITFKDLEEMDFGNWLADEQKALLSQIDKTNLLKSYNLDVLIKSDAFKNASDDVKFELAEQLVKTAEDVEKLGLSSDCLKFKLLFFIAFDKNVNSPKFKPDFKTQNKFFNFFKPIAEMENEAQEKYNKAVKEAEKIEDENQKKAAKEKAEEELNNAKSTMEDIKKMNGFADLSPKEKIITFLFSRLKDLKFSDIESIENIDKVTDVSDLPEQIFESITNLDLASLLKSKLPLCIKTAVFDNLKFEDDKNEKGEVTLSAAQKKSAALKLVSYPYATNLFFQKVSESDKNDVEKDLLQIESMLLETTTAAQTLYKELGLEDSDVEKLNALSKEINANKGKGEKIEERISILRKIGRVLLNILEVPLSIFPLTFAKEAKSFFLNPSKQIQYNESNAQREELGGVISKIKSGQPGKKKEKADHEKNNKINFI